MKRFLVRVFVFMGIVLLVACEPLYGAPASDIELGFVAVPVNGNPLAAHFRAQYYDDNFTSLEWDFGDESTGYGTPITHEFGKEGTYRVTLRVIYPNKEESLGVDLKVPLEEQE